MFKTRYTVTTQGSVSVIRRAPGSPTYPLIRGTSKYFADAEDPATSKPAKRTRKKKRR